MDFQFLAAIGGQTFGWGDLGVIGLLVLLEGALSIDNALVLGLLAKRLPKEQQSRALTYGLVGAFVFRFAAVLMASFLLGWHWVKLVGGGYLAYISIKHLIFERGEDDGELAADSEGGPMLLHERTRQPLTPEEEAVEIEQRAPLPVPQQVKRPRGSAGAKFWPTVVVIELTDIAFAVDSILAALGVVGSKPDKLWVIIVGGLLGVVLMRFAAVIFIRLLDRFPRFSTAAYLLVLVIGTKLLLEWYFNVPPDDLHRLDFHSPSSLAFKIFWGAMAVCFAAGFLPKAKEKT